MQEYWLGHGQNAKLVELPSADQELFPGVLWGRGDTPDTPAYWALRCRIMKDPLRGFSSSNGNLIEEIGFCMLGGFGVTVELNTAAFQRLKEAGVFELEIAFSEDDLKKLLSDTLLVDGKWRRYRFPNQRAQRIAAMREKVEHFDLNSSSSKDVEEFLKHLDGVGPKTSAWILRNYFGRDDVAILDIHVIRACVKLGVFPKELKLPRDYEPLQRRFLQLAEKLAIRASVLDAVMWQDMRNPKLS